ncbi:MAG: ATPase, T2SS/T4P/T4SS family [Gammaproteobacteria bacterium]|nr:ATPase, T2SS/T4P/T4SS family [Gammaproteobacteria bacterium]
MAKKIGDMLKEEGVITEGMIQYALRVQKATKERLGDTLLKLNFVTDGEIARILAKQAKIGFESLDGVAPDPLALSQLPYNFSSKHEILPVSIKANRLQLAVADPFDENGLEKISRYTAMSFDLFTAPRAKLIRMIEQIYYLAEHPIEQEMQKVVTDVLAGKPFQAEKVMELLVSTAVETGASDLHLTSAAFATLVSYRIDGVLHLKYSLPPNMHQRLISTFKVESQMDIAEMKRPQDGRMTFEFLQQKYDMRVSCIPTSKGENLVIRILASGDEIRSLEELGYLPAQLEVISRAVKSPYGMILCTGPTGSGKSTSLYGLLRKVNAMENNVMTVEDPVEFQMPLIRQVPVNVKAGITFASAIKSFLRQDPDVILVGEIRDEETATLGVRAAQTGHLVLSTLHTNDAAGAIARLRDLGVGNFMLASTLSCVIAQRLVRRLCPHCKEAHVYKLGDIDVPERIVGRSVFVHKGCDHCRGTGYLGRAAVCEVIEIDDLIKDAIDDDASPIEIRRIAQTAGMITLREAAIEMALKGITDLDEVNRVVKEEKQDRDVDKGNAKDAA